ncbi:MAG: helix-turn-helix domain-containing protein [Sphaerospermopsis kisseleviana]
MQTKPKFLTKTGVAKLGLTIRQARESKRLTLRQAAQIISETSGMTISYRTVDSIENGAGMPQFNTLVAIAASSLVIDENGKPLTIYDFIDIASESSATMTFKDLLQYELDRRGWTLRQMSNATGIEYEDLMEVFDGLPPQEYVVDALTTQLTNPRTGQRFVYPHEVIDFCQIQVTPNREVDQGLGEHANGIY